MPAPATPPPSPRRGRRPRTYGAVLEATAALLQGTALADLSVAQILAAAGVGRTSFYEHFSSKDDVVVKLMESLSDEIAAELTPMFERGRALCRRGVCPGPGQPRSGRLALRAARGGGLRGVARDPRAQADLVRHAGRLHRPARPPDRVRARGRRRACRVRTRGRWRRRWCGPPSAPSTSPRAVAIRRWWMRRRWWRRSLSCSSGRFTDGRWRGCSCGGPPLSWAPAWSNGLAWEGLG